MRTTLDTMSATDRQACHDAGRTRLPAPLFASADQALRRALAASGLTFRKAKAPYQRDILRGDAVVFTGTISAVWSWLLAGGATS